MNAWHDRQRDRGMALLLCVLLLAGLSLVAIAGAGDARIQVRVVQQVSAERAAVMAAESALAWAEGWLYGLDGSARPLPCPPECGHGNPIHGSNQLPPFVEHQPERWWLDHAVADGIDPETGSRLAQRGLPGGPAGRWLIEEMHVETTTGPAATTTEVTYYRITSRAVPSGSGSPVVLESIIARPWGDASWQSAFPAVNRTPGYCSTLPDPAHCGRMGWDRKL